MNINGRPFHGSREGPLNGDLWAEPILNIQD
jgi:hypothetical protein